MKIRQIRGLSRMNKQQTNSHLPHIHSLIHSSAHSLVDRRDWLTPKIATKTPEPDTPAVQSSVRPYPQVFGPGFEPGLSVLDLLFSQGPAAGSFLQ